MSTSRAIALTSVADDGDGFYFRVAHNDHTVLNRLMAERKVQSQGLILDARRHERHKALRQHADEADIAACLDTQAMELTLPGATSKGHAALSWAGLGASAPQDFSAGRREKFVAAIVCLIKEGRYSEVLAPTHYLTDLSDDWLQVDLALSSELRAQLDEADLEAVRILYPLAMHQRVFYDAQVRALVMRCVGALPVHGFVLRIHPLSSDAGPQVMRSFIEACWHLRHMHKPLMIERAGYAGLCAYALGAVDVVASGITYGDSFDITRLQRPVLASKNATFVTPRRLYLEALGATVEFKVAVRLLSSSRGKFHFACRERVCCPLGSQSMLEDPQRHSALARQRQYVELSNVPASMRAEHFIHNVATPVCDALARASDVHEPFKAMHRRALSVKEVLIDLWHEQKTARQHRVESSPAAHTHPAAQVLPFTPREPRRR
jgi:hypothetical protein